MDDSTKQALFLCIATASSIIGVAWAIAYGTVNSPIGKWDAKQLCAYYSVGTMQSVYCAELARK